MERLRQDSISRTIQMDEMETSLSNMRKNIALVHERKEHLNVRSQIDGELGLLDVVLGQNVSAEMCIRDRLIAVVPGPVRLPQYSV